MSARDVRDEILAAWENILDRHTALGSSTHAVVLELAAAAENRGVRLTAPTHRDDPAADWRAPVEPGDAAAGLAAARSALALPATDDASGGAQ
jgi:hypothetical protein